MNRLRRRLNVALMGGGAAAASHTLLNGLVEYWKMNETSDGTGQVDRAGVKGHTCTDVHYVRSDAGLVYPQAALFVAADGAPGRTLKFPIADFNHAGDSFTFACWYNLYSTKASAPYYRRLWQTGYNDWSGGFIMHFTTDQMVSWFSHGNGSSDPLHQISHGYNEWHLYWTWYDKDLGKQYLSHDAGNTNTTSQNSTGFSANTDNTEWLYGRFGGLEDASYNANNLWDGLGGPVMYWNRVLLTSERALVYNGGAGLPYESF
jgi:hypothetical protein